MTLGDTGLGTKMETRVGPDSASLRRRSHRIERREAVIQSTGIQLTLDLALPATEDSSRISTSSSAAPAGSNVYLCLAKIARIQR